MAFVYTTLASDTMHHANQNPLPNPPWTVDPSGAASNPAQIINNEAVATIADGGNSDNEGKYTAITWPANQWAQFQIDALADSLTTALIVMRRQDNANGYVYEIDGPLSSASIELFSLVAGVPSNIIYTVNNVNVTAGSIFRVEIFGNALTIFKNGVQLATGTDNSFSSAGVVAIDLFANTSVTDVQVSNFSGGSITQGKVAVGWSPVDSRTAVPGQGPAANTGIVDAQGNTIYSAQKPPFTGNSQVSDNTAIPPVDSRAAGAPVDSRASVPVNSRTAPPFHG